MAKSVAKKSKNKYIIFSIAVVLLISALSFAIYIYWQTSKITYVPLDRSKESLGINDDIAIEAQGLLIPEYPPLNIALFGIDQEDLSDKGRSDVIMIMSIDKRNHCIKLSSIMRDTYVKIPGYGMDKINHAFAFGGPELAVKTINSNFDLDIRDYAYVSFLGMASIVDRVGGVEIDVLESEVPHIDGLQQSGRQVLNGKQAVDYARIRYVGNGDYQRTERQRSVLTEVIYKAQILGPDAVPGLVSELLPYTVTTISQTDLIKMGIDVLTSNLTTVKRTRIPTDETCDGKIINGIYYLVADIRANTAFLHNFIYSDIAPNETQT